MNQIVSATETRIHLGEVMRREKSGAVVVERDGKADVVIISKQEYDQLVAAASPADWRQLLKEAHESVRAATGNRALPDPAEMIRLGREERDAQLFHSLG